MYNKKKDATINDNSVLIDKTRTEYSEPYKENQNLKLAIQNYGRYYNAQQLDNYNNYNKRQKYIPKKYHITVLAAKLNMKKYSFQEGKKTRQKRFIMMMLMSMLTKLMHITNQLCQQKMMTMMMKSMIMKKRMLKL